MTTLILTFTYVFALVSCGELTSNNKKMAAENRETRVALEASEQRAEQLETQNEMLKKELDTAISKEGKLQANIEELTALISLTQGDSAELIAKLQRLEGQLTKLKEEKSRITETSNEAEIVNNSESLQQQLSLLEAEITKKEIEIRDTKLELQKSLKRVENMNVELKSLQQDLNKKKSNIDSLKARVESLEKESDGLRRQARTVERAVKPFAGLWTTQLMDSLQGDTCEFVLDVRTSMFDYQLVLICGHGDTFWYQYDHGWISDVASPIESEVGNLESHHRILVDSDDSFCEEQSYFGSLRAVKWSKDAAEFVQVTSTADETLDGVHRGASETMTFSCDEILSRSNRPGIERKALACRLLGYGHSGDTDAIRGCFTSNEAELSFHELES